MTSERTSRRRFRTSIAAAAGAVVLLLHRSAPAEDLTVIRAAVKQRLSLLQTLDVRLRVWEDLEYRLLPGEPEPLDGGRMSVHWLSDRGRIFLEVSSAGHARRLYYDGKQTVDLSPTSPDPSQPGTAFISSGPARLELLRVAVLPEVLALLEVGDTRDLEALLAAPETQIDQNWSPPLGRFDVAVLCPATGTDHPVAIRVGFDTDRDWAPTIRAIEKPHGEVITWLVEEWMMSTSEVTGEEVALPRRGRSISRGTVKDREYRQAIVFEVDEFRLPARIPDASFVATIPPGTEVWKQSEIPGRPAERLIAGGAAAVEIQAANAARKAEQAMAELQKTGVSFSGRPVTRSSAWVFFPLGFVLLAAALLLRRLR